MSELQDAVRRCVGDLSAGANGSFTARLVFPSDFLGFQGHFPDFPVLPGVCLVQAVVAVMECAKRTSVRLKGVEVAKFFAPVRPADELVCRVTERVGMEEGPEVNAQLTHGEAKVAELTLKLAYEPDIAAK